MGAVFAPSSLNFGARAYQGTLSLTKTITIKNISSTTDRYTVDVQPANPGPAVVLSGSETDAIPSGGTASISLTLQASTPESGGFQGIVRIHSTASGSVYRIPYWAGLYVPDGTRILTVSQNTAANGLFSNLADALNAARPENIIEIADSGTYPAGLTISTNAEGLPLHGLTIRAAAGQTPTLDGSAVFGAPGNIRIIGLRNVLIQGLKITGGTTGIFLTQSSTSAPLSVALDHCTIDATLGAQP